MNNILKKSVFSTKLVVNIFLSMLICCNYNFGFKVKETDRFTISFSGNVAFDCHTVSQKSKGYYKLSNPSFENEEGDLSYSAEILKNPILNKKDSLMFGLDNSKIKIKSEAKYDKTKYGLVLSLNGNMDSSKSVREVYIYSSNKMFGQLLLGNLRGIEDRIALSTSSISAGNGDIDGNLMKIINATTGIFIIPGIIGENGYATKMIYLSPRIANIKFGISFTPNNQHLGEMDLNSLESSYKNPQPFDKNNIAVGVNYITKKTGASFGVSFVCVLGKTYPEKDCINLDRFNTQSYHVGSVVKYGPLDFAVEGTFMGKSHAFKNPVENITPYYLLDIEDPETGKKERHNLQTKSYDPNKAGNYNSLGMALSYTIGSFKFTAGYFTSRKNTGFVNSLGNVGRAVANIPYFLYEYKIADGFSLCGGISQYHVKNDDAIYHATYKVCAAKSNGAKLSKNWRPSNNITCFTFGVKISF